jgi:hypothetical protein
VKESRLLWHDVESAVRSADTIMRGDDVGHKMIAVSRLQSLLEDTMSALQREQDRAPRRVRR